MKKTLLLVLSAFLIVLNSCENEINPISSEQQTNELESKTSFSGNEYFLVANRGASTVTIFNANTTEFIDEITLPDPGAQPTYLAHSKKNNSVYVGDFINKKVIYYDDESFELQGEIEIEEGAFHMWSNDRANQLWVNNIVSKTTSVIDLRSNIVIKNIPLPTQEIPELTENAVQHDVTISPSGYAAFITVLDGEDTSYVVMYNTRTLEYIKHEVVGGDAHILPSGGRLYVPAQNENSVTVFNRFTLTKTGEIPFSSAHGIIGSRRFVFATGIADNKIGVLDRFSNRILSEIDTEFNIPHNLAVNRKGDLLFLSHSGGTSTKVVFYDVNRNGQLQKRSEFDSGLNPFGVLRY